MYRIFHLICVIFLSVLATTALADPAPPGRALLALSKEKQTLAIVDPTTLKVVATLPVGPDPHEVVASSDGKTAYVSNTGNGRYHELNVIDLVAKKVLLNFDTEALIGPHGLAFVGDKVWFTAEGAKAVGRYDPKTNTVDWILGTGQNRTHMIHVSDDENQVITTNVDSGTVTFFDQVVLPPPTTPKGIKRPGAQPRLEWIPTAVTVAKGIEGFDVSPNGTELWTATPHDGSVFIIDMITKRVKTTLNTKVLGANRVKFSPDGKRVFISSLRTGELVVYDFGSQEEVKRIHLGHGAAGILMDPDGTRVFVGCTDDNYVAVVDTKKLQMTSHIDVGGKPDGLAWAVQK